MDLLSDLWHRLLFGTEPIEAVQEWVGYGHPVPFEWLSLLGDTWGVLLVFGVAMWLWGREPVYALLGALALASLSKELLSMVFSVPRPQGEEIVVYEQLEVSSFPSGHVYQILVPWGVLYARRLVPLVIPIAVVALVGFSRLYLGVHFLGDIAFAVLFGVLFVWGYHYLWPYLRKWLAGRSWVFYLSLGALTALGVVASLLVRLSNARRWAILGLVVGTTVGLLLEKRFMQKEPGPSGGWTAAVKVGIGLAGLAAFMILGQSLGEQALVVQALLSCAAALWVLLVVPALPSLVGTRRSIGT